MALNAQKTNYSVFSGRRKINVNGICINNTPLNQVNHSNYLGIIIIDDQLSWKQHLTFTSRKLSKSIGVLRKVSKNLPKRILLQLYSNFILPYLQYGITLSAPCTQVDKLFIAQKKITENSLTSTDANPNRANISTGKSSTN